MLKRVLVAGLIASAISGCTTAYISPIKHEELKNEIKVFKKSELEGVEFKKISEIEGTSCQTSPLYPMPNGDEAMAKLLNEAYSSGANGVSDVNCIKGMWSFLKNCTNYISCSGTAIKFNDNSYGTGKHEVASQQSYINIPATSHPSLKTKARVALIIGNSKYNHSPLKNPVNDARLMAETLKSLGFDVMLYTDTKTAEMKSAIESFGKKLKETQGTGLFYYAGHGMQYNGENYLIPIDADIQGEAEIDIKAVRSGAVLAKMDMAQTRVNLVILDACRDNPFARSFRSVSRGLAVVGAPSGTLIAFSTAPGDVAFDGDDKNSLYTQALSKYMREDGLKVEEVFKKVRNDVEGSAKRYGKKQTPWESSSLKGDFYFRVEK